MPKLCTGWYCKTAAAVKTHSDDRHVIVLRIFPVPQGRGRRIVIFICGRDAPGDALEGEPRALGRRHNFSNASSAYSEQVGTKRQRGGKRGGQRPAV
jgi:hypothetical protein